MTQLKREVDVSLNPQLIDKEKEALWERYDQAFKMIATFNPCRQHFHRGEFEDALANPAYTLIIGYDGGTLAFFCMLTEDFCIVPWIAPEFYDTHFPDSIGKRVYIPVIFVDIERQGRGYFRSMMFAIQKFMEERGLHFAFFDHGGTGPNKVLGDMITATPRTSGKTIGTQVYEVVETFPVE